MGLEMSRLQGGGCRLAVGADSVSLTATEYEDLFFALPLNTTALYRLLVDTLIEDDARRSVMARVLGALGPALDSELDVLQKKVSASKPA